MLSVRSILCDLNGYHIHDVQNNTDHFQIDLASKRRAAVCPRCRCSSKSIHSRYVRTLAHVPIALRSVKIRLRTRRFRCRNPSCVQRIFAERAEGLGRAYARTTNSNRTILQRIGSIVGSNPGQRLAKDIGIPTSATTLRRRILEMPIPEQQTVRVLGVDDWAWRKGLRYGTLLCDLETGRIVDLLAERSAESVAEWLKKHPGVEIISRDRASCYAEGSTAGAPGAIQVADRWHLLHNVVDALERLLRRHHLHLKRASDAESSSASKQDCQEVGDTANQASQTGHLANLRANGTDKARPNRAERDRLQRREVKAQRYENVVELHRLGLSARKIARQTGMSPVTVRRYLAAGTLPEYRSTSPRGSVLDTYEELIRDRLKLGATPKRLLQELKALGYSGSASALRRYTRNRLNWRKQTAADVNALKPRCRSPRSVGILIVQEDHKRDEHAAAFLQRLSAECQDIANGARLAKEFADMLRQREPQRFNDWRKQVVFAAIPELASFAAGLDKDRNAVIAGMTLEWSNGPTEGHVNRLKAVKRQMYGRAGFQMLRHRLLAPQ